MPPEMHAAHGGPRLLIIQVQPVQRKKFCYFFCF